MTCSRTSTQLVFTKILLPTCLKINIAWKWWGDFFIWIVNFAKGYIHLTKICMRLSSSMSIGIMNYFIIAKFTNFNLFMFMCLYIRSFWRIRMDYIQRNHFLTREIKKAFCSTSYHNNNNKWLLYSVFPGWELAQWALHSPTLIKTNPIMALLEKLHSCVRGWT